MAKRKRLTPTAAFLDAEAPQSTARAPIAKVAHDASIHASLSELAGELETARASGRLALQLPLEDIEAGYLLRDRMVADGEDMDALMVSIRTRGQQVPIEVSDLGPDHPGPRYGLISGWRRLTALRALNAGAPDGAFNTVLAVLRHPETAGAAYLAMIEENELRVGLSYYERARVAARAAEAGLFADAPAAIAALFATSSKAKRSKIGSFVRVYQELDDCLTYPVALPERLGLQVAQALKAGQGDMIRAALTAAEMPNAQAEMSLLAQAVRKKAERKTAPPPTEIVTGIHLQRGRHGLTLTGPGVDAELENALTTWLQSQVT